MALKDLIRPTPTPAAERPKGVTCLKYVRGESKRCLHFKMGGACALPEEFMCVEWLKANGPRTEAEAPAPAQKSPVAMDLFGSPVAPSASPKEPPIQPSSPVGPQVAEHVAQLRGLTTEDIDSFKALGVEVQLTSETYGDLWLVPALTGRPRKELTPEHAATVMRVLSAFPGSQVLSFEKHSNPERPERPSRRP